MVTGARTRQRVDAMHPAKADGIIFLCPKCFAANGGPTGTHSVICWQPKIPKKIKPGPGRWSFEGTSFDDLTLVAGSSSIHLTGKGCGAHFFIRNGMIQGS
jgi:hypothetical protein